MAKNYSTIQQTHPKESFSRDNDKVIQIFKKYKKQTGMDKHSHFHFAPSTDNLQDKIKDEEKRKKLKKLQELKISKMSKTIKKVSGGIPVTKYSALDNATKSKHKDKPIHRPLNIPRTIMLYDTPAIITNNKLCNNQIKSNAFQEQMSQSRKNISPVSNAKKSPKKKGKHNDTNCSIGTKGKVHITSYKGISSAKSYLQEKCLSKESIRKFQITGRSPIISDRTKTAASLKLSMKKDLKLLTPSADMETYIGTKLSGHQAQGSPSKSHKKRKRKGYVPLSCQDDDVEMFDASSTLQDVLDDNMDVDCSDPQSFYIVLDTNIMIYKLKFIDELKDTPLQGCGPPHIFIPWVVIQELDSLKTRNKNVNEHVKQKAADAVRYLYSVFNSKHPRFHGQSGKMASKCAKEYENCNDDSILSCCLQLAETRPKEKIILLTEDKNLCNKAFINELTVHTMDSLLKDMKSDLENIMWACCYSGRDNAFPVEKTIENNPEINNSEKKRVDIIICKVRIMLKKLLEPYLHEAMIDAYGDTASTFLPDEDLSLVDILLYYRKYWKSVFGVLHSKVFDRHIDNLSKLFRMNRGYFCESSDALKALESSMFVCEELQHSKLYEKNSQSKKYEDIVKISKQLEEIWNECRKFCHKDTEFDQRARNDKIAVYAVFNHIWELTNYLCGTILDVFGMQHDFIYKKPDQMPSEDECKLLISNLYPALHKIRRKMEKVLQTPSCDEKEIKYLYDYLINFVPSLQIQAESPPTENFTVNSLKAFCCDKNNGQTLLNGFVQLQTFYSKLGDCIHKPIWNK